MAVILTTVLITVFAAGYGFGIIVSNAGRKVITKQCTCTCARMGDKP